LEWVCEDLVDLPSYMTKRMFGGLAIYVHHKMVLVLVESPGDREYRDQKFDFDLWNGLLIPTNREFHQSIQGHFPALKPHPILGKWLYLNLSIESFESDAIEIAKRIGLNDNRFGIIPGVRSKTKKAKRTKKSKNAAKTMKGKKTNKLKRIERTKKGLGRKKTRRIKSKSALQ